MVTGEGCLQTQPPQCPFLNENGIMEMPEIKGFEKLTQKIRTGLKEPDLYPFASGVSSIAFASRKSDAFIIKVNIKPIYLAIPTLNREWNSLYQLQDTGLVPKPIKFYVRHRSIKMENLFNPKRQGGILTPASAVMERVNLVRLAQAVIVIHAAGVPHGDLHVNNFMLDQDGNIVLLDFGKAIFRKAKKAYRDANKFLSHVDVITARFNKTLPISKEIEIIRTFAASSGRQSDYCQYLAAIAEINSQKSKD